MQATKAISKDLRESPPITLSAEIMLVPFMSFALRSNVFEAVGSRCARSTWQRTRRSTLNSMSFIVASSFLIPQMIDLLWSIQSPTFPSSFLTSTLRLCTRVTGSRSPKAAIILQHYCIQIYTNFPGRPKWKGLSAILQSTPFSNTMICF